jgi:AraC family ethanolamine operon transcriptional activator
MPLRRPIHMRLEDLLASPVLNVVSFSDIDQFRHGERLFGVRSVPLDLRKFSAGRAVLRLPDCEIVLAKAFPRIFEGEYRCDGSSLFYTLDENAQAVMNGVTLLPHNLLIARGTSPFTVVQRLNELFVEVGFRGAGEARGWPDGRDGYQLYAVAAPAISRLRSVTRALFGAASYSPADLDQPAARTGAQEALFAAADGVMFGDGFSALSQPRSFSRHYAIVRSVDELLESQPHTALYSAALAKSLGITVRTIHNAFVAIRGMSVHRYLRLRRLWAARQALVASEPGVSVKSVALSHGFWHLSEFAGAYRAIFAETPSQTLARTRRHGPGY